MSRSEKTCAPGGLVFLTALALSLVAAGAFAQWRWMNPDPQSHGLHDVWSVSPDCAFAVGNYGTILRFDGLNWRLMESGTTVDLRAVWGTSFHDVWAVGLEGTVLHFDGVLWTSMDSGTENDLYGIWGASATNVFAVGDAGTVCAFDGMHWDRVFQADDHILLAVWGSSATDVFIVGGTPGPHTVDQTAVVWRFDGATWSLMEGWPGWAEGWARLNGVWGSSAQDVYAVGNHILNRVIWHYDGGRWEAVDEVQVSTYPFFSVSGRSASDVWAGGGYHWHRFDGHQWEVLPAPVRSSGWAATLRAIAGPSPGDVWAVGDEGGIYSFEGIDWVEYLEDGGLHCDLEALWGFSETEFFTVGSIYMGGGFPDACYGLYGDKEWHTVAPRPVEWWADGVWGTAPDDVFVVGSRINHFDGTEWETWIPKTYPYLRSVWGSNSANVFVVGRNGFVTRFDGHTWTLEPSGTNRDLNDVWGSSNGAVFTVGNGGTILQRSEGRWRQADSGTETTLRGVWGSASGDVFAVGYSGTILHFDGSTWSSMQSPTNKHLSDIWGAGPYDVYAVGDGGTILHFDGNSWSVEDSGTNLGLRAVWCTSHDQVFVGGDSGTILFRDTSRPVQQWREWPLD